MIHRQVTEYFESNNLFVDRQSGFRQRHSCESALQLAVTEWRQDLDLNKIVVAVFLDLRRAFETIDRTILINKLQYYGIQGVALQWFTDYLTNRAQVTNYNGTTSEVIECNHGVPQGSVLGPLLFIIYINDIGCIINDSKLNLFADDTLISASGGNVQQVVDIINNDLSKLDRWLITNKLKLNTDKTKCMVIASKNNLKKIDNIRVCIDSTELEIVEHMTYLGVTIDNQLKFNKHIDVIVKKIAKKIGFLARIGQNLSCWSRTLIYHTIIQPHFDYCSSILFMTGETQIQRLQLLQNRSMRVILQCNKYTPIVQMFDILKFTSVRNRITIQLLIFIYKILNNLMPLYFQDFLICNNEIHNYATRSSNLFRVKQNNKKIGCRTIFKEGLLLFNGLPVETRNAPSLSSFKRRLRKSDIVV